MLFMLASMPVALEMKAWVERRVTYAGTPLVQRLRAHVA